MPKVTKIEFSQKANDGEGVQVIHVEGSTDTYWTLPVDIETIIDHIEVYGTKLKAAPAGAYEERIALVDDWIVVYEV